MASTDDVRKLAALARIEFSEEELAKFAKEFDSVLAYVGQIESLKAGKMKAGTPPVRNVLREDAAPHEKGAYTTKLTEQFPAKEGNALKVPQIIAHD